MTQPGPLRLISTNTAEHYTWGQQCDAWILLKSDAVHVLQESMPPGTTEVMHYHGKSRQLFYVLRGELAMRTESGSTVIPPGCAVVIEPLTPHQARNESADHVDFLVVSCPPTQGDRFNSE